MQKKYVISIILACILFILTGCNSNTTDKTMAMDDLKIGDYIELGKYDEQPILWRVIHIDKDGNPLLFSDKIISLKMFDAKGSYHKNEYRKELGSNYWKDSNIRQWLNSSENTGEIKWIQNPPSHENTFTDIGTKESFSYDKEKGFLAEGNFTSEERSMIKTVSHKSLLDEFDMDKKIGGEETYFPAGLEIYLSVNNYDLAYYEIVEDKVFLLSTKEIDDYIWENKKILGEEYHIGKPTKEVVKKANNKALKTDSGVKALNKNKPYIYWLRTPITAPSGPFSISSIDENGNVIMGISSIPSKGGIRPALFLDKLNVSISSGKGTESKPFIVSKN